MKQGQENLFALRSQIARLEAEKERESKRIEFFEEKRKKAAADTDEFLAELLLLEKDILQAREDLKANAKPSPGRNEEAAELERAHRETEAGSRPGPKKSKPVRGDYLQKFAEVTEAKNEGAKLEKELELVRRQEEKIRQRQAEARAKLEEKEREIAGLETARGRPSRRIAAKERTLAGLHDRLSEVGAGIEDLQARRPRSQGKTGRRRLPPSGPAESSKKKSGPPSPSSTSKAPSGFFTDLLESDPADAPLIDVFWKEEARATVISAEDS